MSAEGAQLLYIRCQGETRRQLRHRSGDKELFEYYTIPATSLHPALSNRGPHAAQLNVLYGPLEGFIMVYVQHNEN